MAFVSTNTARKIPTRTAQTDSSAAETADEFLAEPPNTKAWADDSVRPHPSQLSKMQNNPRGEPEIVLGIAEEARLQHVALHAQADSVDQAIVDASTKRAGKRSVRFGKPGGAFVYVRSSE